MQNCFIQGESSGRSTPSSDSAPGKLFVGGLSWQTNQDRLREYFGQFGTVTDVLVMKDPITQVGILLSTNLDLIEYHSTFHFKWWKSVLSDKSTGNEDSLKQIKMSVCLQNQGEVGALLLGFCKNILSSKDSTIFQFSLWPFDGKFYLKLPE